MLDIRLKTILVALLLIVTPATMQAENYPTENNSDELYNPVPDIMHHISDSHEWHLWGEGENSVTIPLPVILYTKGNGFDVFMSSDFHHGHSDVPFFTFFIGGLIPKKTFKQKRRTSIIFFSH